MTVNEKRIGILTADFYEESEVLFPYFRLLGLGARVQLISPAGATPAGKGGLQGFGNYAAITEVSADALDGLLVPGGFAPDLVRRNEDCVQLIAAINAAAKPLGFICHGAWAGITADVISGKNLTSVAVIKPELQAAGAHWVDEPVVVDGHLVTAQLPPHLDAWVGAFASSWKD